MPSYPSYHNIINLTKSGISTCRHAHADAAARISIKEGFAEKASKQSQFIMPEITSVIKKVVVCILFFGGGVNRPAGFIGLFVFVCVNVYCNAKGSRTFFLTLNFWFIRMNDRDKKYFVCIS